MSMERFRQHYLDLLATIREAGFWKEEKPLLGPQGAHVVVEEPGSRRRPVLNFCANNYLGLADHPEVIEAAREAMGRYGFGMASVRFICGTQDLHQKLEERISRFLGTEETILYSSCFDANGGLFETLLGQEDAVISDALNHASIIDGVRLSKAQRRVYAHSDLGELERALVESKRARVRMVATDGVFSMHGDLARLEEIAKLTERHGALLMVDDSHATGVVGPGGRGTPAAKGVAEQVDLITSTLGKAMGGATGGFTSGRRELVDLLRQRSRPYLFSNSVAPPIAAAGLKALEILEREPQRLQRLAENGATFRREMAARGFAIPPGEHPIVPILIGDEKETVAMARRLREEGIYVVGFTYPVVPRGQARIRVQLSAAHSPEDIRLAVAAFERARGPQGARAGG
jgi:glycine C-acetyltransferase